MMNNKKTICFVAPTRNTVGGIYTWYLNIKKPCELDFDVLEIDTSVSNPTNSSLKALNLLKKFFRVKSQRNLLKKYIAKEHIDILHICTSGGFGSYRDYELIKIAKKHKINIVLHLHFGKTKECLNNGGLVSKWLNSNLNNADEIISIDESTSAFLEEQGLSNVSYVPNPVKTYLTNTYNPQGRQYLLFIGYVINTKGISELLTAFREFSTVKDLRLLIVGPYEKKYIKQLKNEGHSFNAVDLKGRLSHEETMHILRDAKFLVLPSYTEGMPNVILEAMACGVPVLATDVGNIKQMCGPDVVLATPKDAKDLLTKMFALDDDYKLLKQSTYLFNRAKNLFSIEEVYKQLKEVWNSL